MKRAEQDYYLRVRPVVGEDLLSRRLWVWSLGYGYLAAEALARTGLRQQRWFTEGESGHAFCRSLGWQHRGQPAGEALARHCREHNHLEPDWDLSWEPRDPRVLAKLLASGPPDLLLARGDEQAEEVARAAIGAGVPLIMTFVPRSGAIGAIQLVWLPESQVDPAEILQTCRALSTLPSLDLDREEHHIYGLEARSWALAIAKWILLRDRLLRPDLEEPVVRQGRALMLRGQPDWPWAVRMARPESLTQVLELATAGIGRYLPPPALLRGQRVLVLGLGTASLFCAEAAQVVERMLLVDCKEVTPVNPVRQVYTTRDVGRPKSEALAEILGQRLAPGGTWSWRQEGPVRLYANDSRAFGAVQLRVRAGDRTSLQRFSDLLDRFDPTLAVVGMGRTRNDNFVATAELRRRGIRHVTPSAFPGVTHFKHVLTDGTSGPCYDCIQGHLTLDAAPGPTLSTEQREMFYGGSQPATLAETYPSCHSLLRLAFDLALPGGARPPYLMRELSSERPCFVGANQVERLPAGDWLYGLDKPFSIVTFGIEDLIDPIDPGGAHRCSCGRINAVSAT